MRARRRSETQGGRPARKQRARWNCRMSSPRPKHGLKSTLRRSSPPCAKDGTATVTSQSGWGLTPRKLSTGFYFDSAPGASCPSSYGVCLRGGPPQGSSRLGSISTRRWGQAAREATGCIQHADTKSDLRERCSRRKDRNPLCWIDPRPASRPFFGVDEAAWPLERNVALSRG